MEGMGQLKSSDLFTELPVPTQAAGVVFYMISFLTLGLILDLEDAIVVHWAENTAYRDQNSAYHNNTSKRHSYKLYTGILRHVCITKKNYIQHIYLSKFKSYGMRGCSNKTWNTFCIHMISYQVCNQYTSEQITSSLTLSTM